MTYILRPRFEGTDLTPVQMHASLPVARKVAEKLLARSDVESVRLFEKDDIGPEIASINRAGMVWDDV